MKKRIIWIDKIRTFSIICIVLGHTIVYSKNLYFLQQYLYSFHVPIFFVVSGFLLYENKENKIYFVKKEFKKNIIPYFLFSFLFLIPYLLIYFIDFKIISNIGYDVSVEELVIGIFYGVGNNKYLKQNQPLWFLPCFFVTNLLFIFLKKFIDISPKLMLFISFIISFISSCNFVPLLPFGLSTGLTMLFFMIFGYNLRILFKKIAQFKIKKFKIISILLILIGCYLSIKNSFVLCMTNDYGNFILFIISSIFSILGYFFLFYELNNENIFSKIGKHTLEILVFHKSVILIFQRLLGGVSFYLLNGSLLIQFGLSMFVTVVSIAFSILIVIFCNKIKNKQKM